MSVKGNDEPVFYPVKKSKTARKTKTATSSAKKAKEPTTGAKKNTFLGASKIRVISKLRF